MHCKHEEIDKEFYMKGFAAAKEAEAEETDK